MNPEEWQALERLYRAKGDLGAKALRVGLEAYRRWLAGTRLGKVPHPASAWNLSRWQPKTPGERDLKRQYELKLGEFVRNAEHYLLRLRTVGRYKT